MLNARAPNPEGAFVLYWMQHSQRAHNNPALEQAVRWANRLQKPLFVLFVLDPAYPEANARHYTFMLEGLQDAFAALSERGIHTALKMGAPADIAAELAAQAAVTIVDRGYLRHLTAWRSLVADAAPCLVEMVEGDVIVPVEAASPKMEIGARTLRPKIHKVLDAHAVLDDAEPLQTRATTPMPAGDLGLDDIPALLNTLRADRSVSPAPGFKGGEREARRRLKLFLAETLNAYGEGRADIVTRKVSTLSPYLHFGQISPIEIFEAVRSAPAPQASKTAFIEEMVVRRELAVNFVHYAPHYDSDTCLPGWAQQTLAAHRDDDRGQTYSIDALEAGQTHDRYWNAAMREMRITGYLHNHMRMYWGKRIIAYTKTPEEAYEIALTLNNKLLLDGRDANSYANVAWLFGVHDRGWPERAVFGKVRSMTPGGLERKFDVDAYVAFAEDL